MSEIKVDKVKGRQAAANGPEVTFDSTGNISLLVISHLLVMLLLMMLQLTLYFLFRDTIRVLYLVVRLQELLHGI